MKPTIRFLAVTLLACLVSFAHAATATVINVVVGHHPAYVDLNNSIGRVYVANVADKTISVMDGNTFRIIDTIALGGRPSGLSSDPVTNRFYVSVPGGVAVYDGSDALLTTIAISGTPTVLAFNAAPNRLYVQDSANAQVHVVDGVSDTVIADLPVPNRGNGIAVDHANNVIYVSTSSVTGGSVLVFDGVSNQLVNTFTLPGNPSFSYLAFDAREGEANALYAITRSAGRSGFVALDASTGALLDTVPNLGNPGSGLAIRGRREALTNDGKGKMYVLNSCCPTVSESVNVGKNPAGMALARGPGWVFIANSGGNTVSVVEGFI